VIEPSELDMAQLRHELRELYKHVGYGGMIQVFYEMLVGTSICGEIILEERAKEERS
jgi:hypothetical protein